MARAPFVTDATATAAGARRQSTEKVAVAGPAGVRTISAEVTRDPGVSGAAIRGSQGPDLESAFNEIAAGLQFRANEDQGIVDATLATQAKIDLDADLSKAARDGTTAGSGVTNQGQHISDIGQSSIERHLEPLKKSMSRAGFANLQNQLLTTTADQTQAGAERDRTARFEKANDTFQNYVREAAARVQANPSTLEAEMKRLKETATGFGESFSKNNVRDVTTNGIETLTNSAVEGWRVRGEAGEAGALGEAERLNSGGTDTVSRIIQIESGGNPNAKAKTSSALGLGQFVKGTWLDLMRRKKPGLIQGKTDAQILAMRTNPELAREMVGILASENSAFLKSKGIEATPGNIYLAHFLGQGGAQKILGADPSTPVSSLLTKGAVDANASIMRGKTAGDVAAWAKRKMAGATTTGGDISPEQRISNGRSITATRNRLETAAITREKINDKEIQVGVEAALTDLSLADTLTQEDLDTHRGEISPAFYIKHSNALINDAEKQGENEKFLELSDLARADPDQAKVDVRTAFEQGQINKSSFNTLNRRIAEAEKDALEHPGNKEIRAFLREALSEAASASRSGKLRRLQATLAFDDFVDKNPNLSRDQYLKQARTIVEDFRRAKKTTDKGKLPIPKLSRVNRSEMTLDVVQLTVDRTNAAVKANLMTQAEAAEEFKLLMQWKDSLTEEPK